MGNSYAEVYERMAEKHFGAMLMWIGSTAVACFLSGWWGLVGLTLVLRSLALSFINFHRAQRLRRASNFE